MKTENNPNIFERLNAVQDEVSYIQKEKKKGMQYSIVSHDAVTAKVRPLMVKHGIVYHPDHITYHQNGNRTEVHMIVRFQSVNDDRSDFIDVHSLGYGIDSQDKGPGKAISYAVKYALLKVLGLETGDDPDLDQTTEHHPDQAEVQAPRISDTPIAPEPDNTPQKYGSTGTGWAGRVIEQINQCQTELGRQAIKSDIEDSWKKASPEDQRLVSDALIKKKIQLKGQK